MSPRLPLIELTRQGLSALPLYSPDTTPCRIDLSDNTNLWGAPPAALHALRGTRSDEMARYPTLYSEPLRGQLLDYVGLRSDASIDVVTGCGSDDVLDSAMRAFARDGASIAFSAPTFSMIPVLARLTGLHPVPIPYAADLELDAERLVDQRANVTYLCTPNNPTGTAGSREAVEFVVRNAIGLVIIDEAYAEFAPETFVGLVEANQHVLITRTFSKAFGLAGLRFGFGVGDRELTRFVARARGPYKVNAAAERVVQAVLEHGSGARQWVAAHARLAVENREKLASALQSRGLAPLSSHGNFVFMPTPDALRISQALRERGILVRLITGVPAAPAPLAAGNGTGLRIGVGPWDVMQTFLQALDEIIACT